MKNFKFTPTPTKVTISARPTLKKWCWHQCLANPALKQSNNTILRPYGQLLNSYNGHFSYNGPFSGADSSCILTLVYNPLYINHLSITTTFFRGNRCGEVKLQLTQSIEPLSFQMTQPALYLVLFCHFLMLYCQVRNRNLLYSRFSRSVCHKYFLKKVYEHKF